MAFDGYVISGIDFDIDSLSVLSNTTAYSVVALTHDPHSFRINLNGTSAPGTILIGLELSEPAPPGVPEPATAALAAIALVWVGMQSRRRRSSSHSST